MISVCFITKDESKWIGECIEHLKPIISEFILVDTGSTDDTIAIARSKGAQVYQIEWPHDFSAARNISLQYATQPWILKIDPDERLDSRDFSRLMALTQTDVPAYQFWTRAYTNDPSRMTLTSYQACIGEYAEREKGYRGFLTYPNIRLFKNSPEIRYRGKIHESVESTLPGYKINADGRITSPVPAPLDIYFHHYGHTDAASEKKSPLYNSLIQEELKQNPNNWYVLFEMGIDQFRRGDFRAAIDSFCKADRALPKKPQVLSNLGLSLLNIGERKEAEAVLRECLAIDPFYHDAALNLGLCYFETNEFQQAIYYFDEALKIAPHSFTALRAKGQALAQTGDLDSSHDCFRAALKIMPHFLEAKVDLAIVLINLQKADEAKQMLEEILDEDPHNARASLLIKRF
ncbi:MAG: tetratricopeptide repeat protein [Deltaproteobacteria bacterium]|nr:tetratricopeptide repeat protein [Deltaproteobacteria bacterium]